MDLSNAPPTITRDHERDSAVYRDCYSSPSAYTHYITLSGLFSQTPLPFKLRIGVQVTQQHRLWHESNLTVAWVPLRRSRLSPYTLLHEVVDDHILDHISSESIPKRTA